ncbi:MAG: prepilin-type N-terminal cleavage/methylation domain-containing protein [Armatimonadetes bacterium]|nr:prepilin-type N-terminal cleavage/methylation domain-containing protein [Armatimonadota bacterium]
MRRARGFTLVELLVVIAILALLAAIIFPVFAKARERGRMTACLSHLKQLGSATLIYADDYDGYFPFAVDWADRYYPQIWDAFPAFQAFVATMSYLPDVVDPYLRNRQVWQCPSDSGIGYDPIAKVQVDVPHAYGAFGMSYSYRTELAFRGASVAGLTDPAGTNVLNDADGSWHFGTKGVHGSYRLNVFFADGHAKSLTLDQTEQVWDSGL